MGLWAQSNTSCAAETSSAAAYHSKPQSEAHHVTPNIFWVPVAPETVPANRVHLLAMTRQLCCTVTKLVTLQRNGMAGAMAAAALAQAARLASQFTLGPCSCTQRNPAKEEACGRCMERDELEPQATGQQRRRRCADAVPPNAARGAAVSSNSLAGELLAKPCSHFAIFLTQSEQEGRLHGRGLSLESCAALARAGSREVVKRGCKLHCSFSDVARRKIQPGTRCGAPETDRAGRRRSPELVPE